MVLAGPGSGKTSVIVERTAYMINEGGISPSNILVVTFSRAAAKEMKERFLSFTGQQYTPVTFGTFHGVFYGILKQAYGFTAANILSDEEKFGILRELTLNYGGDLAEEGDFPEEIAREISVVKGNKIALEHYYSSCCPDEVFRQIYQGYREACQSRRKLDFDDMILYCYELFVQRKDILEAQEDYTNDPLFASLSAFVKEKGYKNGYVMWPLRTAVSGKQMTPAGATEIMEIIGKEETLKRVKAAIEKLS